MRVVGTAAVCALAAFGAAFLAGRAGSRQTPARAAVITRPAKPVAPVAASTVEQLAAQFAPQISDVKLTVVRPRRVRHHRQAGPRVPVTAASVSSSQATSQSATPPAAVTPVTPSPSYVAPSSGGSSHTSSSGGGSGSGTTSIGGHSSSGSGKTTIGG